MYDCGPILDGHDNFFSYSNSCASRILRRGAGAVCSNSGEVQCKQQHDPEDPDRWISRQRRPTRLLSSSRLQDATRHTHLFNKLVV